MGGQTVEGLALAWVLVMVSTGLFSEWLLMKMYEVDEYFLPAFAVLLAALPACALLTAFTVLRFNLDFELSDMVVTVGIFFLAGLAAMLVYAPLAVVLYAVSAPVANDLVAGIPVWLLVNFLPIQLFYGAGGLVRSYLFLSFLNHTSPGQPPQPFKFTRSA